MAAAILSWEKEKILRALKEGYYARFNITKKEELVKHDGKLHTLLAEARRLDLTDEIMFQLVETKLRLITRKA